MEYLASWHNFILIIGLLSVFQFISGVEFSYYMVSGVWKMESAIED